MSWEDRLREMVLAGGVLLAGCNNQVGAGSGGTGGTPGVPCGNASPDPCICGRPAASSAAFAECEAKTACEASGAAWLVAPYTDTMGVLHYGYCQTDAGVDDATDDGGGGAD
jgi:hypothetical protein